MAIRRLKGSRKRFGRRPTKHEKASARRARAHRRTKAWKSNRSRAFSLFGF